MQDSPGPVDLAAATEEELCVLPGVGPALARRIVRWRTVNGGFGSVDQLAEIKGIGEARMEALRPYVVAVGAPVRSAAGPARREPASRPLPRPTRSARFDLALIGLAVVSQVLVVVLVLWVL